MRTLLARLHRDLPPAPLAGRLDLAGAVIPLSGAALFLASHYHARPRQLAALLAGMDLGSWAPIAPHVGWFLSSVALFLVAPLALLALLGEPLGEYGLGPGRWRLGLAVSGAFAAIMVPVAVVAARHPAFAASYPLAPGATRSWELFAVYEVSYAFYFVAWEAIFRSFLLVGLYRRMGVHAVYVLAIPFAILHAAKPEAEAFGSIVAAVALGYLALHTRSFWWGALVHVAVALSMDLAAGLARLMA
jgi:membrane protease YdiL (CAAX protease family)